ncbi:P2Y purinoceptor 11 isoform X1 [Crotalus tigris]|uniref:P2Y purinoceptor 11 isoform X1 n=2 Tax=Crotalus tigris TaxID=88082 RepID=UPI00192F3C3C|nr:P2Y purinoceptor 11 isoform X1 [Crotalus tigris]
MESTGSWISQQVVLEATHLIRPALSSMKTGNLTHEEERDRFQGKLWVIIVLQFFFAVLGNGFTIYHFVAWERTWHSGIIYSFNLALCDLFYAISLLPLAVYYFPPKDWKYGFILCKLDRFVFFVNMYGSTFFIACISLNRYIAIVHPFFAHKRIEPFHAKVVSGVVWFLAIAISAPVLYFSTVESKNSTKTCLGSASTSELPAYRPYSWFLLTVGCALPFLLTLFSCVAIVCAVRHSHGTTREEKSKVKILISTVVLLYALFYLPFHIFRNMNLYFRMNKYKKSIYFTYQITKILVHFHVCIHPFIYAALAKNMPKCCCKGFQHQKELQGKERNLELQPAPSYGH